MLFCRAFSPFLALLALFLFSAEEAMDWLRRGNTAFLHENYQAALESYAQAIQFTNDQGQVAFQQSAVYTRLEDDIQAAAAYQRCLEDAKAVRRVMALYVRGNALAQTGHREKGKSAVTLLRLSLKCLEQSLSTYQELSAEEKQRCSGHADNIAHNLQIVRTLLAYKEKEAAEEPEQE